MAVTFDIILAAIFLWFVIRYWMFGFVRSILRAGRFLVSLVLAAILCRPCALLISSFSDEGGALIPIWGFVFAFIAVYLASSILIKLIGKVKIPIVSGLNKLIGLLLGLIVGILITSALGTVIYTVLEVIVIINPESVAMDAYYDSYFFRFVYDLRVFEFIRNII